MVSCRVLTGRSIHRSRAGAQVTLAALASLTYVSLSVEALPAEAGPPPVLRLRAFEIHSDGAPGVPAVHRRIQIGAPAGWTPSSPPGVPELELRGPEGEGRILVFAGLHPSHLGPVLARLKEDHPSAAPSPPEPIAIPGLRPEMGERATRFAITGHEVGEMVMLEKHDTILLLVTVVEPKAWEALAPVLAKVYPTVTVTDITTAARGARDGELVDPGPLPKLRRGR